MTENHGVGSSILPLGTKKHSIETGGVFYLKQAT
jgi:hypothetical protein